MAFEFRPRCGFVSAAFVAVVACSLALAPTAAAQQPSAADKETARALMDKGDEKMDAKDYAAAIRAYEAADAIMRLPMTGVAVAKAQAAAGLLVEARDKAMDLARTTAQPGETPAYARARSEAAQLANALAGRIPSIQVVLANAPAGVSVVIDGASIPLAAAFEPRKVNPGAHVVVVSATGFDPARAEVTVREGETRPVPIKLSPAVATVAVPPALRPPTAPPAVVVTPPPVAARSISPLVPIGFSVAGAGIVVGAITGAISLSKTSTLKTGSCPENVCASGTGKDISAANTLANISNVTFGVGAAGLVVGVVGIVISRPKPAASAYVTPTFGPGSIGLAGAF